jgi:hypothetical protein
MSEKMKFGLSLCLGLGLLSACTETVDSKNIRTGGIAAFFTAEAPTDSATTVRATLKVGGESSNTYVDLSGGDRIFAQAGDKRVEMESQGTGQYEVDFNTAAEGTDFIIDLQREVDDDAPLSRGTLPAPFAMTLPNMPVSRKQELTITWAPSGSNDDVTIELSGTCIFSRTIEVAGDPGTHKISPGTLISTKTDKPESCDINVEMKRSSTGTPDAVFDNESSFVLSQVRTGKFTSSP